MPTLAYVSEICEDVGEVSILLVLLLLADGLGRPREALFSWKFLAPKLVFSISLTALLVSMATMAYPSVSGWSMMDQSSVSDASTSANHDDNDNAEKEEDEINETNLASSRGDHDNDGRSSSLLPALSLTTSQGEGGIRPSPLLCVVNWSRPLQLGYISAGAAVSVLMMVWGAWFLACMVATANSFKGKLYLQTRSRQLPFRFFVLQALFVAAVILTGYSKALLGLFDGHAASDLASSSSGDHNY
jgi:hypothetical protein